MHFNHDPAAPAAAAITFDQFLAVDIRVGRIVAVDPFPDARKPSFKLTIDFGPAIGIKRSSAQITEHYTLESLAGRLIAAVVNFPPRQIGKISNCAFCFCPSNFGRAICQNHYGKNARPLVFPFFDFGH